MLDLAQQLYFDQHNIYNKLIKKDFHQIAFADKNYDIITFVLSLNYTSNFVSLFDQLQKILKEKSIIAITVATTNKEENYYNFNHSMFIISISVLEKIFLENNFKIITKEELEIFDELPGHCYILTLDKK